MSADFEMIVRNVRLAGGSPVDVAMAEGRFVKIGEGIAGSSRQEIDGTEKIMMPGVIDAHVHFNEPGREAWEGFETGSRALAAGGGAAFFDMPLNSTPPVLTAAAVEAKRDLAGEKSRLDFGIWGGMTPDSLEEMPAMADAGVIGFKAFLCDSGLAEFGKADSATLRRGMKIAAGLGRPVAVHAEDDEVIASYRKAHRQRCPGNMADWLASRPVEAELSSIRMALDLAGETGADLHVVHVSHATGLRMIAEARAGGVKVTAETCPHYLLLDAGEACEIGPLAKCAPPLREFRAVEDLWRSVKSGLVTTIGSDHSPSPPEMKSGEDIFSIWGGIAGCQHGFELLCNEAIAGRIPLMDLAKMTSEAVARRFRLPPEIGAVREGSEASFFLMAALPEEIREQELLYRHPISAYTGRARSWRIIGTYLRGQAVDDETRGRFLQPQSSQ